MTRRAVGLIDLLVSMAIVAVLMGLLISAIQRVRAVATRLQCTNHLKQQALALHQFHDSEGGFPNSMNPGTGSRPYLSWRAKILPYLEQQSAWDQANADFARQNDPFRPTAHANLPRVMPMFSCPADDRTATAWIVYSSNGPVGLSSYLASSGTQSRLNDGVFSTASHTQIVHITDGTSQTLLIGERPPSADLKFSWWYAGIGLDGGGKLEHHLGVAERRGRYGYHNCAEGPYAFGPGDLKQHCDAFHYWSLHTGGANFAFADGSVHFLRYSAAAVLPALATRGGGETVGDFE